MSIRFHVPKHQSSLTLHGRQVESVLHEEDDVNVFRFSLGSDERTKHDETRQLSGGGHKLVNAMQPAGNGTAR